MNPASNKILNQHFRCNSKSIIFPQKSNKRKSFITLSISKSGLNTPINSCNVNSLSSLNISLKPELSNKSDCINAYKELRKKCHSSILQKPLNMKLRNINYNNESGNTVSLIYNKNILSEGSNNFISINDRCAEILKREESKRNYFENNQIIESEESSEMSSEDSEGEESEERSDSSDERLSQKQIDDIFNQQIDEKSEDNSSVTVIGNYKMQERYEKQIIENKQPFLQIKLNPKITGLVFKFKCFKIILIKHYPLIINGFENNWRKLAFTITELLVEDMSQEQNLNDYHDKKKKDNKQKDAKKKDNKKQIK